MIGKNLAHYEIQEKLGSGGMGDVYRARDTKLARDVAIKVLPAEFSNDPERRKRFAREAQAIAALKHPNIITIHSVEESDDVHYITMEFVEGETLSARIPKGGLPIEKLFEYAIELADAVSSAHEDGITHRDLKPANVMFDKKGRLKVLDFGLAKLLDPKAEPDQAKTVAQGSDTAIGQILGTAAYMSPEQAEGKPIDHRSDIFSLGIMLYEMATGERPFTGDTHVSTISSVIKDTPPHVSEIKQTLPRHLGRIVNHCLEKKPDNRLQSAKDVRNELQGLKKEIDSGSLSQTMTSATSFAPAPNKRAWLPWVIVGAVVVVAAGVVWTMRPSGSPGDGGSAAVSTTGGASESSAAATSDDDRRMTVVLPFENLGPPEDAYFAAGVTGEITNRLAAVSGLGVISRTSATQYDRTGKTIRQIGDDLGVEYVVEGTVQWAKRPDGGGRVRINPQLIRVTDDTSIWSDSYDREMDDIFEVQSEIAGEVIKQLDVTLLGSERELVENAPTENSEAYQLYLQAKDIDFGSGSEWQQNDSTYVALMTKATELDPGFIDAWAELSMYHSIVYVSIKMDDRLSLARAAMQKAEALDPNHYQTHLARGEYYYYGFRDYERALGEFLAATELMPSHALSRHLVGLIYRRQGKWNETIDNLKAAFELDPQDGNIPRNLAGTYRALREFEEAVRYADMDIKLEQQSYWTKAETMIAWKGDVDTALEVINQSDDEFSRAWLRLSRREYSEAIEEANKIKVSRSNMGALAAKLHLIALAESYDKGVDHAQGSLEEANKVLVEAVDQAPGNEWLRRMLAANLALLGQGDAAAREGKLVVDLTAKDKYAGPVALELLASVYGLIGREDEAIDILEDLLSAVYSQSITRQKLAVEPYWDPLRDHPRFKKLLPQDNI